MNKPQADSLTGPIYGVQLLDTLPLGTGGMLQQMPSRYDLQRVQRVSERTVAGIEVLTSHYRIATEKNNHMLAALSQIAELDYSRAAVNGAAYDAVKIAKKALEEYGQKIGDDEQKPTT